MLPCAYRKKSGRKSYRFVYVLNKLKPERVYYVYYVKSDDLIIKSRLVFLKRLILKRYTVLLCGLSEIEIMMFVALLAFILNLEAVFAASAEDISIKTLPPDYARPVLESADALLSDWEGEHWASLDADLDKVALAWTTSQNEAIFQVRRT